ncbi:MAG TPA: nuclear transport factor 2 family protein [Kofleriaceae bacterium]|jgi:hypothetical protein
MTKNAEAVALAYMDAVTAKDFARLEAIFAPNIKFEGPSRSIDNRTELMDALRRMSAILVKNDVKRVFSDGSEVCVIYDVVTDAIAPLPTVEWLTINEGRIQSIKLFYDQVPWQKAREEMAKRAQARA